MNAANWARSTAGAMMATVITHLGPMAHAAPPTPQAEPAASGDVVVLGGAASASASAAQPPVVRAAAQRQAPPVDSPSAVAPQRGEEAFEKRAASFASFARNQAAAGFRVSLQLTPSQVAALNPVQREILSQHEIRIDVVDTKLASVRPGASHAEREWTLESNDRQLLTPNAYFANNYSIKPSTVLQMEG